MDSEDNIYQLKGLGASPGKIVGRVKLVFGLNDLEKVEKGDIIVAPMTNPDMTVALGKASAIITDAGGLASHAAIIARELKIPAVVGTGIATRILREGMVVEVNGSMGGVKILSSEDVEIPKDLTQVKEKYTIFGNLCPIVKIRVPRKGPFFERILDLPWEEPPDEIKVIAPRPEIRGTPLTGSLIIPALERLPYSLGFPEIGPMYTYIMNGTLHISYEKISKTMERSKSILFNKEKWQSYLKDLYEKYNLFTKAAEDFRRARKEKTLEEILENDFINYWKAHNSFFSQTFLIQAWGDDIVWPQIRSILEKYYPREELSKLLSKLSKLSEPIPSIEFYSDFQKLVSNLPSKTLERLISGEEEKRLSAFKEIGEDRNFKKFIEKWYWVRDRDFYYGDLRDVDVFSRFVKLLYESRPIQRESLLQLEAITKAMGKLDREKFEYLVEVGRILKRERDYHHFLWLKNTSVVKDFFLDYGSNLKGENVLEESKDIFFLWIPEIYRMVSGELKRDEISKVVKIRKKIYLGEIR